MEEIENRLAKHPFLLGLKPELLKIIVPCAVHVHFDSGKIIYKEGDQADQFLLILDGKIAIEIFAGERGSLVIQTLGSGDVLGWSWLFDPYIRRFDARAVEYTEAIALNGKLLREKAEADYRLGYELLKRFSRVVVDRLLAASRQLIDVYGKHS